MFPDMQGNTSRGWRGVGSWLVVCAVLGTGIACNPEQRIDESRLRSFGRYGRSVAMSLGIAAVGAPEEDSGHGAVYVLAQGGDVFSPAARIAPPVPGFGHFGDAVAIDGSTLVVGAPRTDRPGAFRAGAVYVFELSANAYTLTATLSSPAPHQAWEAFGTAVAVDGDRIVVGAPDRDVLGATDAGMAYVFERSGSSWTYVAGLSAPLPASSDKHGAAVAVFGDSIAVGAPLRDFSVRGGTNRGAVYVYEPGSFGYVRTQSLAASDGRTGDGFGQSLAGIEDAGTRRLLVGAAGVDVSYALSSITNAGAAYLYESAVASSFGAPTKLGATKPSANAGFGGRVAISTRTLVVGAAGTDGAVLSAGAAHVFRLAGGGWSEEAILVDESPDSHAILGSSVAIAGDLAIVGAQNEDLGQGLTDTGSAHVFRGVSGSWSRVHVAHAAESPANAAYGRVLAVSDDTLVSGNTSGVDVAHREVEAWSLTERLVPVAGASFQAVAVEGDTLALFSRQMLPTVGRLEIRTWNGTTWALAQTITPDLVSAAFPEESANGAMLALRGDVLVLGCPRWNGGDGRVFVYRRAAGSWSLAQTLDAPTAASTFDTNFGTDVVLDGSTLVISEVPSAGIPGTRYGRAHVLVDVGGTFVSQQVITSPTSTDGDYFASSIALDGDLLAVARAGSNDAVLVYRRTAGSFALVWSLALTNQIDSSDRRMLDLKDDVLALGLPAFDYEVLTDAGELRLLRRELDDTFVEENVLRANRAISSLGLGREVRLVDGLVIGTARQIFAASPGRVYAFPR